MKNAARILCSLTVVILCINSFCIGQSKINVVDGRIKRLAPFGAPDTLNDSYFYGLAGLICTEDGRLFLSDTQAGCIRVFSLEKGNELYRIGRKGSGPGEFRSVGRIRLLNNAKLGAIDYTLRRCTIFELDGTVNRIVSLKYLSDDLDFINDDTLVVSAFLFDFGFKPLRIMKASEGKVIDEFGKILDPREGLVDLFQSSPARAADIEFYSRGWMTRVVVLPNQQAVVYSQRHPYKLMKYDLRTKSVSVFSVPVDINTEDEIIVEKTGAYGQGRVYRVRNSGQVMNPAIRGSFLLIPIFSADVQTSYLDCYDLNGEFKKRLRIPSLPAKNVRPLWSTFRGSKELLVLIRNEFGVNWVERFSLILDR